jgi:hypothetical protein
VIATDAQHDLGVAEDAWPSALSSKWGRKLVARICRVVLLAGVRAPTSRILPGREGSLLHGASLLSADAKYRG